MSERDDDVKQMTTEVVLIEIERMLMEFYTPAEAFYWLVTHHQQLSGDTPLAAIATGRADEVVAILHRLDSGAYL